MKIVIRPGVNKVKVSYEEIFDNYSNDNLQKAVAATFKNISSPYGIMLLSPELEQLKNTYGKAVSNVMGNFKTANGTYDKFFNKSNTRKTKDIPKIIPATGHDICNYIARYGISSYQIQTVMKLDGKLDFNKLSRAVRLTLDEQPVFGCKFVESEHPYWKRLKNIDKVEFCFFEETDNAEEAVQRFIESPLDMDKDPQVRVKLIRSGQYDTLCVKVNHACCDGSGTKEYIRLLSEIYTRIDSGDGTYKAKPHIGGRKDQERLFEAAGISKPETGWNPLKTAPKTMWTFPLKRGRKKEAHFSVCRFSREQLESIAGFGKARGATVNDLILTAFYRAMFDMSHTLYGVPMDITSAVDLRRYLPDKKTEAIRNFTGGFDTMMPRIMGESFEKTLARVSHQTKKVKSTNPGIESAKAAEVVEKMRFSQIRAYYKGMSRIHRFPSRYPALRGNMCTPTLSNIGVISDALLKFGSSVVTDAYIVPPAVHSPGLLLFACTYNGVLTLQIGYYKGELRQKDAEKLLNKIRDELVKGCTV